MKNTELKALRKLFFLTTKEAATHIAGLTTARQWQYWEAGKRGNGQPCPVPDDVAEAMMELQRERVCMINEVVSNNGLTISEPQLNNSNLVTRRLSQSVAAHFYSMRVAD